MSQSHQPPRAPSAHDEVGREVARQAAAEHAERDAIGAGDGAPQDPATARYRYLYRALREIPMPAPPASFAMQMERLTRDHPEQATVETWLLRVLGGACVVAAGVCAVPALQALSSITSTVAQELPWSLLLVTALGLGLVWVADRKWTQAHRTPS